MAQSVATRTTGRARVRVGDDTSKWIVREAIANRESPPSV